MNGGSALYISLTLMILIGSENNPLHVAATCIYEATHHVVKLFVEAFLEDFNINPQLLNEMLSWYSKNKQDEEPLHLATRCQPEQRLTLYLFWSKYLKDSSTGQNVLHLASTCTKYVKLICFKCENTNKDLGRWLVKKAHEFITQPDSSEMSPLDIACNVGATWILEAMLEKDLSSVFNNAPLAWIKACEN
ncbi:Alkaline nuclease [Bienertia sinuspersici]